MTAWPNSPKWRALQPGEHVIEGATHEIAVVDCGDLMLPSGRLVAADPFVTLERHNRYYPVPPGTYPVRVTVDETIQREMYVSLIVSNSPETERRVLVPFGTDGRQYEPPEGDRYYGVAVDAGTVCFVDDEAVRRGMPPEETMWLGDVFDNDSPSCWFKLMDNPDNIRAGLANIKLPLATDGSNIVISHSGWGDGFYPVVGGYDAMGNLVAVHIDLLVHPEE